MYQVSGLRLTLLDTVTLEAGLFPRVDGHSQQVYMPRGSYQGVAVVSWEGNRLTTQRTLKCVGECRGMGVMSTHTMVVCDRDIGSASVVSVTDDTVTARLSRPEEVGDQKPWMTAVLDDSVLMTYEGDSLVIYENGVSSAGTMVTWPAGLHSVNGVSSDGVSRFLLCDWESKAVFILDVSGKMCGKINIDTDSWVEDCTVVDGNLWVGCSNGDIVVMSPQ